MQTMDNLQQEYNKIGYTITEKDGVFYVQKQETTRNSKTIPVSELREKGRDDKIIYK